MKQKNLGNIIIVFLICVVCGGIFYTGQQLLARSSSLNTKQQVAALVEDAKKNLAAAALNSINQRSVAAGITQNNMGDLPNLFSVFTHKDPSTAQIMAVFGDFKNNIFKPLVTSNFGYEYSLSPDKKQLYYYQFTEIGQNSIWRVDVTTDTAPPVHLFDIEATPISFFPSFDGTFFVMLEHAGISEHKIMIYDLQGKIIKHLLNLKGQNQIIGWVDAQNLLILNYPPTNAKRLVIYNVANDQMQEMPVTKAKMLGMDTAVIAPNGRNVILTEVSNDNLHWKLYRLDLINQIVEPLLELNQAVSYYDWSSQGKEILIASKDELWRCPVGETCAKTILPNLKADTFYSFWLEDTSHLLMAFSPADKHFLIWSGSQQADLDLNPLGIKDLQKASFWTK